MEGASRYAVWGEEEEVRQKIYKEESTRMRRIQ